MNVFANDVVTAQTAEIGIMQKLLSAAPGEVNRRRGRPSRHHKPESVPMRSSIRLIGLIATPRRADALVGADLSEHHRSAEQLSSRAGYDAGSRRQQHAPRVVLEEAGAFDTVRGLTFINSDLAFGNGHYAYQGNFAGFTIWDVSNPAKPVVASVVECITSQGDPTDRRQPALRLRRGRGQSQ